MTHNGIGMGFKLEPLTLPINLKLKIKVSVIKIESWSKDTLADDTSILLLTRQK